MDIVIRSAEAADHADLVDQFQGLNQHEDPISHDRLTDRAAAEASLAVAWRRVRENDGHALVAERDGVVVGHLFMHFERDAPYVREGLRDFAYVSELYIREVARGAGIGTALMQAAERLAADRGVARMMIGVLAGNHAAEALYVRLGYARYVHQLVKPIARQS